LEVLLTNNSEEPAASIFWVLTLLSWRQKL